MDNSAPKRVHTGIRFKCGGGKCYVQEQTFDLTLFKGAFPRGIYPTDLDGIVEIRGHFLVTEFKMVGAELTQGQRLMFEQMTKNDRFTVFILYVNYPNEVVESQLFRNGNMYAKQQTSLQQMRQVFDMWASKIEGKFSG